MGHAKLFGKGRYLVANANNLGIRQTATQMVERDPQCRLVAEIADAKEPKKNNSAGCHRRLIGAHARYFQFCRRSMSLPGAIRADLGPMRLVEKNGGASIGNPELRGTTWQGLECIAGPCSQTGAATYWSLCRFPDSRDTHTPRE